MNPAELRMMWMSQYNGLSIVEDQIGQAQMDMNPMMSLVGGDFNSQAAAALGMPQTSLIAAANGSNIYGLAQLGSSGGGGGGATNNSSLQQQLQQSASQMFQSNFATLTEDDYVTGAGGGGGGGDDPQNAYDQMDDAYEDGISELTPKQEIINIDEYVVMMNDSNSYDGSDYVTGSDKDVLTGVHTTDDEHKLLMPLSEQHKLLAASQAGGIGLQTLMGNFSAANTNVMASTSTGRSGASAGGSGSGAGGNGHHVPRSQRKTRKIEPVNRPGLVLKTPIAYRGNIDPSVIPIKKDGMAVCERCGAIGVKHTFYTKSRRFCSMSCARGELYSMVLSNNKMSGGNQTNQQQQQQQQQNQDLNDESQLGQHDVQQQHLGKRNAEESDIELALRVSHINKANYSFRLTDSPKSLMNAAANGLSSLESSIANEQLIALNENSGGASSDAAQSTNSTSIAASSTASAGSSSQQQQQQQHLGQPPPPKALKLYHDVLPQEDLPQIPKYESLPVPCPQMEKIISIRRRAYNPLHSYDWTPHLQRSNFFAASVTSFPHAPGYDVWHSIDIEMKVEVENTDCDHLEVIQPGQTPHSFWVATILNICGYKALMRYEGFDDDSHDFWVNLCNAEVHAVGWCATRGKPLIPPRTIENKYKDWKDFLVERLSGARTLPSNFYNKINDSMQSRFRLGLNVECVDKNKISQVRLATVTKIVGKRLFLRYFDNEDGFWCHEDSPIIHPVGWATTVGHEIHAPPDYMARMLAGRDAMIEVHEDDATIELFKMNFTFEEYYMEGKPNSFVAGMKLEAVDPLNLSSICAATVMAVLKFGYMMIRIDSYPPDETNSDWFCYHEKSASIFPVGFCATHEIVLTPPKGYDIETFNWETYLRDTGSVPAGPHLFHHAVPNHGFEVGMSLECADLMDPRLVCVAHVGRVVGRLLKIQFDGWPEEYDQWLDCESPDIYPVGWCILVNHKLEPPKQPTPVAKSSHKSKQQKKRKKKPSPTKSAHGTTSTTPQRARQQTATSAIPTIKTRTIPLKTTPHLPKLSIKLGLKPEHHKASFYEHNGDNDADDYNDCDDDDGDDDDEEDADGSELRSNQSTPLSAVTSLGGGGGGASSEHSAETKSFKSAKTTATTTPTTSTHKTVKKMPPNSIAPPAIRRKANSYIANSTVSNSKYIPRMSDIAGDLGNTNNNNNSSSSSSLTAAATTSNGSSGAADVNNIDELMPHTWNIYDVSQFLRVNDCTAHCDTFSRNKIDGKRLLQLSKDEILTLLGMKVGPALKILDLIQQLKCKINPSKSRLHNKANKSAFL